MAMKNKENCKLSRPDFISKKVTRERYFFLNLQPDAPGELVVACGGYERTLPDYKISRRRFPFYCIECVAEGRGRVRLSGRDYELSPGSVFTYGPGVEHHIVPESGASLSKYFLDFSGTRADALLKEHRLGAGRSVRVTAPEEITRIFELMIDNGRVQTPFTDDICVRLLELLVLKIRENILHDDVHRSKAYRTYLRCCSLIEENATAFNSLDDIAEACYIDRSYLCRLFKRFASASPYQKLMSLKMHRGAELLLKSQLLVKQIAAEVDCCDSNQFSRSFKRVYGISPEKFRKLRM